MGNNSFHPPQPGLNIQPRVSYSCPVSQKLKEDISGWWRRTEAWKSLFSHGNLYTCANTSLDTWQRFIIKDYGCDQTTASVHSGTTPCWFRLLSSRESQSTVPCFLPQSQAAPVVGHSDYQLWPGQIGTLVISTPCLHLHGPQPTPPHRW